MGTGRRCRQGSAARPTAALGRVFAAAAALGLVALAAPHPAGAATARCPRHALPAAWIRRELAAGRAVSISNRYVVGALRLPAEVRAPVTLHRVTLCGPLLASSTSFDKLVDLRGSRFRAEVDFTDATFNGPAVLTGIHTWASAPLDVDFATFHGLAFFGGAIVRGPATFADTEFNGPARFRADRFDRPVRFGSAVFGDIADFSSMHVKRLADFSAAEFDSVASFSASHFMGKASFATTRFSQFADFSASAFGEITSAPLTFFAARFDGGVSFLDAQFFGPTSFSLIQSGGDVVFDGTDVERALSFVQANVVGDTTFARATLRSLVNFDEADVHKLDLDGAMFVGTAAVILPQPGSTTAHLDELRFDPADVGHIGTGTGKSTDAEREQALALVSAAALRGGDAKAANQAQYLRHTLIRDDRTLAPRLFDWVVLWGAGGYSVRPWHQVITLVVILLGATAIRVFVPRLRGGKRGPLMKSFKKSFGAMWSLKLAGSGWAQFEVVIYKVVFLVLLLNLANVWPFGHDLVKGVLS